MGFNGFIEMSISYLVLILYHLALLNDGLIICGGFNR